MVLEGREFRKGLYLLKLETPAGALNRKVFVP
jgi:hypothetical protein